MASTCLLRLWENTQIFHCVAEKKHILTMNQSYLCWTIVLKRLGSVAMSWFAWWKLSWTGKYPPLKGLWREVWSEPRSTRSSPVLSYSNSSRSLKTQAKNMEKEKLCQSVSVYLKTFVVYELNKLFIFYVPQVYNVAMVTQTERSLGVFGLSEIKEDKKKDLSHIYLYYSGVLLLYN